jgi:hypothetical protein
VIFIPNELGATDKLRKLNCISNQEWNYPKNIHLSYILISNLMSFKSSKHYRSIDNVRNFMFNDIEKLLRPGENVRIGAPNFLLALGLSCYTEYWGKLVRGVSAGLSQTCFEEFFRRLGNSYAKLLDDRVSVYKDIRCGLAHSYMIEESSKILIDGGNCGIEYNPSSQYKYKFYVKYYFQDFKRAVNDYIYGLEIGSENVIAVKNALENKPDLI